MCVCVPMGAPIKRATEQHKLHRGEAQEEEEAAARKINHCGMRAKYSRS